MADDMGLGKTIQVIAYLAQLFEWYVLDSSEEKVMNWARLAMTVPAWAWDYAVHQKDQPGNQKTNSKMTNSAQGIQNIDTASNARGSETKEIRQEKRGISTAPPTKKRPIEEESKSRNQADVILESMRLVRNQLQALQATQQSNYCIKVSTGESKKERQSRPQSRSKQTSTSGSGSTSASKSKSKSRRKPKPDACAPTHAQETLCRVVLPYVPPSRQIVDTEANGYVCDERFLDPVLFRGSAGPHCIIAPASTVNNWYREFTTWCPIFRVVVFGGSAAERREASKHLCYANIVITSYSTMEIPLARKMLLDGIAKRDEDGEKKDKGQADVSSSVGGSGAFDVVVLDEAHEVRNSSSTRFAHILSIPARHRLLLTGTPIQNHLSDLVSLLRLLMPDMFAHVEPRGNNWKYRHSDSTTWSLIQSEGSADAQNLLVSALQKEVLRMLRADKKSSLLSKITRTKRKQGDEDANETLEKSNAELVSNSLQSILGTFVLRRTKESIQLGIPPKTQNIDWPEPTAHQKNILQTLQYLALVVLNEDSVLRRVMETVHDLESHVVKVDGEKKKDSNLSTDCSSNKYKKEADQPLPAKGTRTSLAIESRPVERPEVPNVTGNAVNEQEYPCSFIGELAGVLGNEFGYRANTAKVDELSSKSLRDPSLSSGSISKLLPIFRKAAIHPLLLRTWYTNSHCIAIAKAMVVCHQLEDLKNDISNAKKKSSTSKDKETTAKKLETYRRAWSATHKQLRQVISTIPAIPRVPFTAPLRISNTNRDEQGQKAIVSGPTTTSPETHWKQVRPPHEEYLNQLLMNNKTLSKEEIDILCNNDAETSRLALSLLTESDYAIHCTIRGYVKAGHVSMEPWLLPIHAFLDSGKILWLGRKVNEWKSTGSRAVVFSQFTGTLDLIEEAMKTFYRLREHALVYSALKRHTRRLLKKNDKDRKLNVGKKRSRSASLEKVKRNQSSASMDDSAITPPQKKVANVQRSKSVDLSQGKEKQRKIALLSRPISETANNIKSAASRFISHSRSPKGVLGRERKLALGSKSSRVMPLTPEKVAKVIEKRLACSAPLFMRLDGSTPVFERQKRIDVFSSNKEIPLFLASTRAGGQGINITAADKVVIFDSDWNPSLDRQVCVT